MAKMKDEPSATGDFQLLFALTSIFQFLPFLLVSFCFRKGIDLKIELKDSDTLLYLITCPLCPKHCDGHMETSHQRETNPQARNYGVVSAGTQDVQGPAG